MNLKLWVKYSILGLDMAIGALLLPTTSLSAYAMNMAGNIYKMAYRNYNI